MSTHTESAELSRLTHIFEQQKAAFRRAPFPDVQQRRQLLKHLQEALLDNAESLTTAVNSDFGNRSRHETRLLELFPSIEAIKHAHRHLHQWMRPERRPVSIWFQPGRARVIYQPLGVVGIVVSWNYPLYVALGPLVCALAAGNRSLIKMSEFAPHTSEALKTVLAQVFSEEEVAVFNGEIEVAQAFVRLPFDHLLFTGSTAVGKLVMQAACANLTPVTLELGGKSPALIGPDADWKLAVQRIIVGKLFNAGQTCVAPDYVMLPAGKEQQFIDAARAIATQLYPQFQQNPDYTCIINQRQYQRLESWLQDATAKGAQLVELLTTGEHSHAETRKMMPTLICNTTPAMTVMQEEIFGPLLPVVSYHSLEEAIAYINDRPRPLALYYFGKNQTQIQQVLENTISGGVTINDTIFHVAQDDLPFGGVGASGMGHYHGREGFETFSKKKGIFYQSRINAFPLLYPPYGKLFDRLLKVMLGR